MTPVELSDNDGVPNTSPVTLHQSPKSVQSILVKENVSRRSSKIESFNDHDIDDIWTVDSSSKLVNETAKKTDSFYSTTGDRACDASFADMSGSMQEGEKERGKFTANPNY